MDSASASHHGGEQNHENLALDLETVTERRLTLTQRALYFGALWWSIAALSSWALPGSAPMGIVVGLVGLASAATGLVLVRWGKVTSAASIFLVASLCLLLFEMTALGSASGAQGAFLSTLVVASAALLPRRTTLTIAAIGLGALLLCGLLQVSESTQPTDAPWQSALSWLKMAIALLGSAALLEGVVGSLKRVHDVAAAASREREEVESRYVSAQKLEPVGQLASGVAHDFNNLLSVMMSVSTALRTEQGENQEVNELLDDLDEATARASQMTGQLLAFSRRRTFDVEAIDLDDVVQSISPMLTRLLGDEITVTVSGTTDGLSVEADRGQLEQVLLNLAVNARDAMPQGGTLGIRLGRDEELTSGIFLEVSDTGEGVPAELVDQIFTPFFSTKPTGTGLGLATVRDIVTRMCGTISVKSECNQGTAFRIQLPASSQPPVPQRPSISGQIATRKTARILLTEDHELLRRATQRNLEKAGFSVTSVVNGQEALALILGGAAFDVLITDISMPKMGGLALVRELDRRGHSVPTVFMSGNAGRVPKELAALSTPFCFVAKPFSQEDFVSAIEKSIGARTRRPAPGPQSAGTR